MKRLIKYLAYVITGFLGIILIILVVAEWFCASPELNDYLLNYNETRLKDKAPLLKQSFVFDSLKYSANHYQFRYKNDIELGHTLKTIYLFDCLDPRNGETDVFNLSNDSSISIRYTHLLGSLKYELWIDTKDGIQRHDTFFEIKETEAHKSSSAGMNMSQCSKNNKTKP